MLSVSAVTLGSMNIVLPLLTLVIGTLLGAVTVLVWSRRAGDPDVLRALSARGDDQAVLRDGLERLHERLMDVEQQRASWQGQLRQQVDDMRHSTDLLRRETGALSTALRKPHVRGQWGELHLRRAVELAGMVEHCDFQEQVHLAHEDGNLRPDVVVRLAGGRSVVVDAKVPLDAHLDALATDDPEEAAAHLRRHVRQVRSHVDALSGKAYWRSMPGAPEFVVMFVPAESFLAVALDSDPTLLSYAATRDVVIATPTTLIALLRTIAHGWTTEALAERTREIHELGRELHTRIGVMGGHLDKVGRSLKGAVEAFNSAVGSIESRVLVTARQFEDIGVTREELAPVEPVTQVPRPLTAAELLDAVADETTPAARASKPTPGPASRADRAPEAAYVVAVSAPTLWEEGQMASSRVVRLAILGGLLVLALDIAINGHLTLIFDIGFVLLCVWAALAVRPRDFFPIGVLPPLLLLGLITLLAIVHKAWVAQPGDGLIQAVVSGLAHRATGLLTAYLLTLAILAIRQRVARKRARQSRRLLEASGIPGADPGHHGRTFGEVDDGRRLRAALAGVEHRVQPVIQLLLDLPPVGHRLLGVRHQQRAGQQRLTELLQ